MGIAWTMQVPDLCLRLLHVYHPSCTGSLVSHRRFTSLSLSLISFPPCCRSQCPCSCVQPLSKRMRFQTAHPRLLSIHCPWAVNIDIARNIGSEAHAEAAPTSEYSARKTDTPSAHIGEPEHRTDVTTNTDDFTSDLERSASDSADNPSVTKSTDCHTSDTTDKCYDERIVRGEGNVGIDDSSEAEARGSQLLVGRSALRICA
jgi:hypothetical protein